MIKNLVLKGGGVLGQAYTGALLELDKRGVVVNLERVAGTSAGSIVATLVALKYTARQIFDISAQTDFKSFEDGRLLDKINVAAHYGINPGDEFLDWITDKITHKGLPACATFKDFQNAGSFVCPAKLHVELPDRFCNRNLLHGRMMLILGA